MSSIKCKRLSVAVCLLTVIGCGLDNYESHIDKNYEKVSRYDADAALIGPPLQMPRDKDGQVAMPVPFFLRPPTEVRSEPATPDPKASYLGKYEEGGVPLFLYPGSNGINICVATGVIPKDVGTIKLEPSKGYSSRQFPFAFAVRESVGKYVHMRYGRPGLKWRLSRIKTTKKALKRKDAKAPPLEFDLLTRYIEVDEQPKKQVSGQPSAKAQPKMIKFDFYFYKRDGQQAAVVFEVPSELEKQANTLKAIDLSLATLSLGPSAIADHSKYQRQHGSTPSIPSTDGNNEQAPKSPMPQ